MSLHTYSQLTGYVFDNTNYKPLDGAVIEYTGNGYTLTDSLGKFFLNKNHDKGKISISHIGYKTSVVGIKPGQTQISIGLNASNKAIKEVIVSITDFNQPYQSIAGSVSLLAGNNIMVDDQYKISEVLNRVPGIFMHSGSFNTNRLIIRGIGSRTPYATNRVKAYFEEIPLTSGEGISILEDIDLQSIGRIEVIKGPASGIYGAGLGGAVNIFADRMVRKKYNAQFLSSYDPFGLYNTLLKAGYNEGNMGINIAYNYLHNDGYRQNNLYNRHSFYFLSQYNFKKILLKLFINHIDLLAYIPSSIDKETFDNNPRAAASNWLQVKGHEDYTKTNLGLVLIERFNKKLYNHTAIFSSLFNQYESRPFNILDDNSKTIGVRSKLTFNHELISGVFGLEAFCEWYYWSIYETLNGAKGIMVNNNKELRSHINLFGHIKKRLFQNSTLTIGMNYNQLMYTLNDKYSADSLDINGSYRFNPILSPRINFMYDFKKSFSLYGLVSHGFSAPSLQETLNPEGLINKSIKPESGWNFEIGSKGELFNQKIYFDFSLYFMYVKNLLVTKRIDEDIFTGINAGKTNHFGSELSLIYNILSASNSKTRNLTANLNANITSNKFIYFVDDNIDFSNKYLPGIPFSTINAVIYYENEKGPFLTTHYQYISSMYLNDANDGKTAGYSLWNAKMGYKNHLTNEFSFEIFAGVRNILNTKYASMILVNARSIGNNEPRYYYPGLPVSFYAGIRVQFEK